MSKYSVVNAAAKKKKRKKIINKIVAVTLILVFICIGIALWIYWKSMTPTILDIAKTRVSSETARLVNEAVCSVFSDAQNLSDLIVVEKNTDGEIVMISANSAKANSLARNTALLSQNKINALAKTDIDIPLGTLTGVPLLSEKGPLVNVVVTPIGAVNCEFTSVFESAGINQTLHRIYLTVRSEVDLIVPSAHMLIETSTPVLLCESLIVGKVPQTYLQGGLLLGSA